MCAPTEVFGIGKQFRDHPTPSHRFPSQLVPAIFNQRPAAEQEHREQNIPPNAAGQGEQQAVFLPNGEGEHIHVMYKEQPQAVPSQKAEYGAQRMVGV